MSEILVFFVTLHIYTGKVSIFEVGNSKTHWKKQKV